MKSNTIIRTALLEDASPWSAMLLQLDKEVEYTMFEAGERSPDISKYKDKIIATNNYPKSAIFFAIDDQLIDNNIVGYLSVEAFRNNSSTVVYVYRDKNQKQLFEITLTPEMYQ